MDVPFEGGCQCGDVRYRCDAAPFVAYTCHCRDCRRLTASAFALCLQVPTEALTVVRGRPSRGVRIADSGNRLETAFCPACGSALFVAPDARPRIRTIYGGTLDRAEDAPVSAHIWTSRRLPWVVLPAAHRRFEEAADWRPDYAHDPTRLDP